MRKVMGGGTGNIQLPHGPLAPTSAMCSAPTSEMRLKLRTSDSRLRLEELMLERPCPRSCAALSSMQLLRRDKWDSLGLRKLGDIGGHSVAGDLSSVPRDEPGTHVLLAPISTWKECSGKGFPSRVSDLWGKTAPRPSQLMTSRTPAPPPTSPTRAGGTLPPLCLEQAVRDQSAQCSRGCRDRWHHSAVPITEHCLGTTHSSSPHAHFRVFRLPRAGRHLLSTPSISSSTFQPAGCEME